MNQLHGPSAATRVFVQSRYFPILIGAVTGALLRGAIGFAIDNQHIIRWKASDLLSRWVFRFRLIWENCITREWQALTPLLEDEIVPGDPLSLDVNSPAVSCQVCHNLIYDSPHRYATLGAWRMRGTGWYDYFVEDKSCPYPQTRDWVASAIQGCVPCQIVVDAVSAYSPQIFKDYTPELDAPGLLSTHIRAWGNPGKPLAVSICRPWNSWYSEREEYLEVFTKVGSPLCWPTIASAHPVCPDTWGTKAIEKINRWLDACDRTHCKCQRNRSFTPKRLIEINDTGGIRLVEPEASSMYVALSYCWGTRHDGWLMTLESNIVQHSQSIDSKRLPQGLSDAIILAKALNFDFIWIDALCIIQGDAADLKSELVRMGRLYACADLVIGIDTTKDCTVSFNKNQAFARSTYFGENGLLFKKTFQTTFSRKLHRAGESCSQNQYEPFFLKGLKESARHASSKHTSFLFVIGLLFPSSGSSPA